MGIVWTKRKQYHQLRIQIVHSLNYYNFKGSFAPNTEAKPIYEKKFESDEAPSGMLARGHYEASSKFVDDDGHDYLKFDWSFDIAKDWK